MRRFAVTLAAALAANGIAGLVHGYLRAAKSRRELKFALELARRDFANTARVYREAAALRAPKPPRWWRR